jgi:arginine repressor
MTQEEIETALEEGKKRVMQSCLERDRLQLDLAKKAHDTARYKRVWDTDYSHSRRKHRHS